MADDGEVPLQRHVPPGKCCCGRSVCLHDMPRGATPCCRLPDSNLLATQGFNPPLCWSQGFAAGVCHYAAEYATVVPDWREASYLVKLCYGAAG